MCLVTHISESSSAICKVKDSDSDSSGSEGPIEYQRGFDLDDAKDAADFVMSEAW